MAAAKGTTSTTTPPRTTQAASHPPFEAGGRRAAKAEDAHGVHRRTASRSELRRPLQMPEQRLDSSIPAPSQATHTAPSSPCLQQVQVIQQRLQVAVENNLKLQEPHKAPYHTVRQALPCWRAITEDKNVLEAIKKGVDIPPTSVPVPHFRSPPAAQLSPLHDLVHTYLSQGLVERLHPRKSRQTGTGFQ